MTGLANILNIVGLSLGVLSAVILAFSLNKLLAAIALTADAHDLSMQSPLVVGGLDRHRDAGTRSAKRRTGLGLALLALSFVLQLVAILVSSSAP